ncbi:MAG TPA: NAD-dependent epimerase/dehydratase family protein [Xanthobacteraceae bacterium]
MTVSLPKMKSCLVLGGGGFLGTNLCRRLRQQGCHVRAFGRHALFPRELAGIEWMQGDFADRAALAASLSDVDVVFHLIHGLEGDFARNVAPTLDLLKMSAGLGQRIVFLSSGGAIYGRCSQIPTPETAPAEPMSAYGVSNLAIEKHLHGFQNVLEFRILRVTNAFGPFQLFRKKQGLVAALIECALRGRPVEIWGDGSVVRDFIFVDDILDALEAAAHDDSDTRIFNIGSGCGRTVREVMSATERLLGKKIDIAWQAGRPSDVPISVVSIERAKQILNWSPKTSFENGLELTISWWRDYLS